MRPETIFKISSLLLVIVAVIGAVWAVSNNGQNQGIDACAQNNLSTQAQNDCLTNWVLGEVDQNNPATALPLVDRKVEKAGGLVAAICHVAMHKAGRQFANSNGVNLANLQNYLPRSDSSNCSAGFTHGMMTALGVSGQDAPSLKVICARQTTRARQYACAHGIGHALRRAAKQDNLVGNLRTCRRLGEVAGAECAAGVYHDYFLAVTGVDQTATPVNAAGASQICNRRDLPYRSICWYRQFASFQLQNQAEAINQGPVRSGQDLRRICNRLTKVGANDCLRASAAILFQEQETVNLCADLSGGSLRACLTGGRLLEPQYATNSAAERVLVTTRRRTYQQLIEDCRSQIKSKAGQNQCLAAMAARSIRKLPQDPGNQEAEAICRPLSGQQIDVCLAAIAQEQRKTLN